MRRCGSGMPSLYGHVFYRMFCKYSDVAESGSSLRNHIVLATQAQYANVEQRPSLVRTVRQVANGQLSLMGLADRTGRAECGRERHVPDQATCACTFVHHRT